MADHEPARLALEAMATRFELVVAGDDPVAARAAGEEALREIRRLEDVLSFYRPAGALGRVNRLAADGPVVVPAALFRLLERCAELVRQTEGRFDPTVGPLMRAWGLTGGPSHVPDDDELARIRHGTGMEHVVLDASARTVGFARRGMAIDLGGVGKGFAIDEAVAVLRQTGVGHALLHGGTSTVRAIGHGPGGRGWRVGIPWPYDPASGSREPDRLAAVVELRDEALSVSEIGGKGFTYGGRFHGHVIDPSTGRPVTGALAAAVVGPSATLTDALATALLVLGARAETMPVFTDSNLRWLVARTGPDGSVEFIRNGLPAPG